MENEGKNALLMSIERAKQSEKYTIELWTAITEIVVIIASENKEQAVEFKDEMLMFLKDKTYEVKTLDEDVEEFEEPE